MRTTALTGHLLRLRQTVTGYPPRLLNREGIVP